MYQVIYSKLFAHRYSVFKTLLTSCLFLLATVVYPVNPNKFSNPTERGLIQEIMIGKSININTASEAELVLLNGVGSKKAQAIIAYRKQYGHFKSINDIKKVPGISQSIYTRIKPLITIES